MVSVGISVQLPRKGRPEALVAILEGSWESPTVVRSLNLTSSKTDLATVLSDLGKSVESHLAGLSVDRVVVRRADYQPRQGSKEGPKIRLLAEGAIAAFAKSRVDDVWVLTGKELADRSPATSKNDLDAKGSELVGDDFAQAAAAAAVGLIP